MKEIKLSSKFTNLGIYGGLLLVFILIPVLLAAIKNEEMNGGMLFAGIIFLAMIVFLCYLFLFVCSAKTENNTLLLKKQFRPIETYTFDKIGNISSFRLKTTKYTTVKIKKESGNFEKYIIINSKNLFFKDKIDAEEKLKELKGIAK
ncbi:hypothetical protein [Tenacibaculum finnmarkense]|uniref:hypothetical protein n=1 Tax=Tenacibaculum finnmarkense TaxID=2781243 RepID=UPI001E4128A9|nr:hypothetical protein [Tenacibaculum finnmarkense]MCD8412004.1 hypothetical protein [Tenacibaculum finnmarkense genomovar ulcerans]MCG8206711.1 hypothetical protein [Tenacibaculum finnmarkense genomovar finnmarkense]MCG8722913.1 hypothetical protein [Tenacibaculum finnmarkense]MCG8741113.1 hypothetical protein [Tenacibaculum finnmarkense]MCG8764505.1 hypothetical protein [Tenacibaculum finnmarkense]